MAANSNLNLTSLDFDTLKTNFKTFLKSQSTFKDYDFEGSNMNVLLDVMSYNTYINSFYMNMVASEMFIDSAQKLDSVISHAKELNYVPQSMRSSEANVNIVFTSSGLNGKLTIPKGTIFSGVNSNGVFNFVTSYTATYTSSNNNYYVNGLELFEGKYVKESFVVDYTVDSQKFVLSNPNIDLTSLTINVLENGGQSNTLFQKSDSLFGQTKDSNSFFIQASQNNQYEIYFGDGLYGRVPQNGATVVANYRITNGPKADGVSSFTLSQDLGPTNNGLVYVTTITTVANSSSGSDRESIETIRFRAPRFYATQQRAVSNDDYKSLILSQYGSIIKDIAVFGGQEVEPKKYGSVVISVKPYGGLVIPDYFKNQIVSYLSDKSQMRVIVQNPEYLYIRIDSTVQYNKNITSLYPIDLQNLISSAMTEFSTDHLESFNSDFRYSKFVAHIDDTDASLVSNDTTVFIVERLTPLYNISTSFAFSYNNAAEYEYTAASSSGFVEQSALSSSAFTYVDVNGAEYPLSYIEDNSKGVLIVYTYIQNNFTILNNNIGTIDYASGSVVINNLKTSYYNDHISLYLRPKNKDIIVSKNQILIIDPQDITISIIDELV